MDTWQGMLGAVVVYVNILSSAVHAACPVKYAKPTQPASLRAAAAAAGCCATIPAGSPRPAQHCRTLQPTEQHTEQRKQCVA